MNLELLRQVCVTPGAPGFEDKIRDFIIQEVAPLVDAVHTLQTTKFGSLPVLRDGKLSGIITDNDLLRFLHDLLGQAG